MVTTIQIDEKTLALLKKLKEDFNSSSYDDTINQVFIERASNYAKENSLAGFLGKKNSKKIIDELKKARKENERF